MRVGVYAMVRYRVTLTKTAATASTYEPDANYKSGTIANVVGTTPRCTKTERADILRSLL